MTEETPATIVLETGSWNCKIGYATDELPRSTILTVYSELDGQDQVVFGQEALTKSPSGGFQYLLNNGVVPKWGLMESFWQRALQAAFDTPTTTAGVLANYYPNSNKFTKEKHTQIFFENFNVPQYFAVSNPLLALYSSGRTSGLVLDAGHSTTSVVPVVDGIAHYLCQTTANFGGKDVTEYLINNTGASNSLAVDIKEHRCRVSLDFEKEASEFAPGINQITLPDGFTLDIKDSAIRAPEGVFNPAAIGSQAVGVTDLILNSLSKCENESRKELISNIIVVGGNSNFPNFNKRLEVDLQMRSQSSMKVRCHTMVTPTEAQWTGGAVVSRLDSFTPLWITKAEYDEHGPSIVHRKCI
jgi:actin beta/gamma 1